MVAVANGSLVERVKAAKEAGHSGAVLCIRYEGPKGGPGMKEMLNPTSAVMGAGLGQDVAMLTDGRFSGGSPVSGAQRLAPRGESGRCHAGRPRRRMGPDR